MEFLGARKHIVTAFLHALHGDSRGLLMRYVHLFQAQIRGPPHVENAAVLALEHVVQILFNCAYLHIRKVRNARQPIDRPV